MKRAPRPILLTLLFVLGFTKLVGQGEIHKNFQLDIQGDSRWSAHNYTDLIEEYERIDSWAEIKLAYWLDENRSIAPYVSVIPSHVSELIEKWGRDDILWWQRNIQTSAGVQWYPFAQAQRYPLLRSIRFYALYLHRDYYDQPADQSSIDEDYQIGLDYYYDNYFSQNRIGVSVWTRLGYSDTSFSFEGYQAISWVGNVKVGPKFEAPVPWGRAMAHTYLVGEWGVTDRKHKDRFWENFARYGVGLRVYPKIDAEGSLIKDLAKRFNFYVEYMAGNQWLGDKPAADISNTDLRIGLSYSTSGFYRD